MKRDMDTINKIVIKIWDCPSEYLSIAPIRDDIDEPQDESRVWTMPFDDYTDVIDHLHMMEEAGWVTSYVIGWRLTWDGQEYADCIANSQIKESLMAELSKTGSIPMEVVKGMAVNLAVEFAKRVMTGG